MSCFVAKLIDISYYYITEKTTTQHQDNIRRGGGRKRAVMAFGKGDR
jgi:hypothetical protein